MKKHEYILEIYYKTVTPKHIQSGLKKELLRKWICKFCSRAFYTPSVEYNPPERCPWCTASMIDEAL